MKAAWPLPSTETFDAPTKNSPSPFPDGSHTFVEKCLGPEPGIPEPRVRVESCDTVGDPRLSVAELMTGKFWRLLAPTSASPASFAVTESVPRLMPRLALA